MPEHGVDRVDQIQAGVDQGAIEVENQQLDAMRIELGMKFDQWNLTFRDPLCPQWLTLNAVTSVYSQLCPQHLQ